MARVIDAGEAPASDARDAATARYALSRALFLRALGAIHLIAFVSLGVQIRGLIGAAGILPAGAWLNAAHGALGGRAYRMLPTLLWFANGDGALLALAIAGAILACVVLAGFAARPTLGALWLLYLSLCVGGQDFLQFQWDALLLETTLIAIVFAPAGWRPDWREDPPPIARALVWWLCFRLMFLSGITKLLSGDPTWRGLTALDYHYWTQPLPNPLAWYAARLPQSVQKLSTAAMFVIEMGAPLLILTPIRFVWPRRMAAALLAALQIGIAATGNYGFFNLLAVLLCLSLLDDEAIRALDPRRLARRRLPRASEGDALSRPPRDGGGRPSIVRARLRVAVSALMIGLATLAFLREMIVTAGGAVPALIAAPLGAVAPFRSFNGYGLFRVMTTERPEIRVETSADGATWRPVEFRYNPGDPRRPPPFVAPHMPRLDWQMWFAALDPARARWLGPFLARLLEGSPAVAALLAGGDGSPPPRFVRVSMEHYRFATAEERRRTGAWWTRTVDGPLTGALTIDDLR